MPRFLFRNRWFALVWVLATLVSIGVFFSEGGAHQDLEKAAATIRENADIAQAAGEHQSDAFAEDEEPASADEEDAAQGPRKVRLVSSGSGQEDGEDDGAETYVILDPQTAIPEGDDF
ncbi:MAG TPA: hypothetical protein PKE25_05360 [Novosphingobium sp.]|nr:hypothetical protein [Novosphingobium sp.]